MKPKTITRIERKVGHRAQRLGGPRPTQSKRSQERPLAVGTFLEFVRRRNPSLLRYEHVPRLCGVLQRVADGAIRRLLVVMPPRYFKSEQVSRLFSAYYLRRYPKRKVGLACYGASLAWELSEEARNNFEGDGGRIRPETNAKRRWRTSQGGEMWADGVGGALLGRGYHLGLVDDPIDPQQAHSRTFQARFEKWWPEKFLSRQEPDAAVVVVMQRLAPEDPINYLLRREVGEKTEAAPEHWHVVCFDEIKSAAPLWRSSGPMGLPPTCTLEPDPRAVGEVLAPTRFDEPAVRALQRSAGPYARNAQRQQRPSAPSGDFWKQDWLLDYDELPEDAEAGGKDWDTAFTKNEANSASAFVESYRDRAGNIYIHDCGFEWYEFPELVAWMKRVRGPHHIEAKASGKSAAQTLRAEGVVVTEVPVTAGDKFARAQSVQTVVSGPLDDNGMQEIPGRVFVRRAIRGKLLESERQGLLSVTVEALLNGGPDLDLNDAFVQALTRHVHGAPGAVVVFGDPDGASDLDAAIEAYFNPD